MFNRIRNIRKRWFVIMAAVALLAVGLASGAVFAANGPAQGIAKSLHGGPGYDQDFHRDGGEAHAQVMARVAEILGIEQDALAGAFTTALNEQMDAKFAAYAAQLVADETITQEQADAAVTWFNARPAEAGKLAGIAVATADTDKLDTLLSRMVDAEKLTQEQADAIAAWHADRPDTLPEREGKRSDKGRHHHRSGDDDGGDSGS